MKSRVTVGAIRYVPSVRIERTWDVFPNEISTMSSYTLPIKQLSIILRVPILYVANKKDMFPTFKWGKVWK